MAFVDPTSRLRTTPARSLDTKVYFVDDGKTEDSRTVYYPTFELIGELRSDK